MRIFLLAVILPAVFLFQFGPVWSKVKVDPDDRGFWDFGLMILRIVRKNPFWFNGYGNYCGKGGSGSPVDDLDRCCQTHDNCYTCKDGTGGIFKIYHWDYKNGDVVCRKDKNSECQSQICECDRQAVHCFAKSEYNNENFHWGKIFGQSYGKHKRPAYPPFN